MTKPAEFLAAQQKRGDRLAEIAERLAAAAGTFLDAHANPAPGEACFAAQGTTDLTVALAELPGALREWRTWKWDATGGTAQRTATDSLPSVDSAARVTAAADYIADLRRLADYMEFFRGEHGDGDPDAPPHRPDDPDVVGRITHGGSTVPPGWVPGKPNPPGFPRFERHADQVMRERGADVAQQMTYEPCEYQGVLRPARKVTGIGWTPTCEWHHTHSWDSLAPKEAQ